MGYMSFLDGVKVDVLLIRWPLDTETGMSREQQQQTVKCSSYVNLKTKGQPIFKIVEFYFIGGPLTALVCGHILTAVAEHRK
jgi:hypothetical protein